MGSHKEWDINELSIIVHGILIQGGYADGEVVRIENAEDGFVLHKGADGSTTRAKMHDESGTITLRLGQSNPANAALSAVHNLDKATPGGLPGPMLIRDRQGTTLIEATKSWVVKPVDAAWAAEAGNREWKIAYADRAGIVGGN